MDEWDGLVPSIHRAIKERRARRYPRCSPTGSAHARFGARVEDSGWERDQNQWDSDSKVSAATEMTHRRHGSLEELMAGEGALIWSRAARLERAALRSPQAMSAFMPPALPAPTPPALTVPVAYGVGGAPEGAVTGRGSYGPVIAMLAVVAVLAAAALAVGRLCFGRRALGQAGGGHDLEAWVERTCGHCVGAAMLDQVKEEEGGGSGDAAAATAEAEPPPPEGTERGEGISIAS
uniref:Uncharacterized protein n=2 Tax=Setaria italica TaxID=4555 RepID=K3XPZ7_SETIT